MYQYMLMYMYNVFVLKTYVYIYIYIHRRKCLYVYVEHSTYINKCVHMCVCTCMYTIIYIYIYIYVLRNVPFEKEKMAYCFFQRGTAPSWRTIRKCDSLHFWRNCSDLLRKNPYNKGETMSAHTYLLYMYVYVYIHIFIYIYNTYLVNACSKYACTYKCKTNTIIRHTHTYSGSATIVQNLYCHSCRWLES